MAIRTCALGLILFILEFYVSDVDLATVDVTPNPAYTSISTCPCDLTTGRYDNNCCCDPDAAPNDITISQCIEGPYGGVVTQVNIESCYANQTYTKDWYPLLCVQYFNSPDLGLYYATVPEEAVDIDLFVSTIRHPFYEYSGNFSSLSTCQSGACYQAGDEILTGDTNRSVVLFPQNAQSGNCLRSLPINYLEETTAYCSGIVTSDTCVGNSYLDAATYEVAIVLAGGNATSSVTPTINYFLAGSDPAAYVNSNSGTPEATAESLFTSNPAPPEVPTTQAYNTTIAVNGNTCENAVVKVLYNFVWEANEITQLTIDITMANLSFTTLSTGQGVPTKNYVTQQFYAKFQHSNSSGAVARSGNPGYEMGLPVISGANDGSTVNNSFANQLRIWQAGAGGLCSNSISVAPVFGVDVISGCSLLIGQYNCTNLMQLVEQEQMDLIDSATHVARFGNPSYTNINDWISVIRWENSTTLISSDNPILLRNLSSASETRNETDLPGHCRNVPSIVNLEFLWTKSGKIDDVDINEIIGVDISWERETWILPCNETNACNPSMYTIHSIVTFKQVPPSADASTKSRETSKNCDTDATCWEELFRPLQTQFYAYFFPLDHAMQTADYNIALATVVTLFALGFTMITWNWAGIAGWITQRLPI